MSLSQVNGSRPESFEELVRTTIQALQRSVPDLEECTPETPLEQQLALTRRQLANALGVARLATVNANLLAAQFTAICNVVEKIYTDAYSSNPIADKWDDVITRAKAQQLSALRESLLAAERNRSRIVVPR